MKSIEFNSDFVKKINFKSAKGTQSLNSVPIDNGREKLENESMMGDVLGRSSVLINSSSNNLSSEEKARLKDILEQSKMDKKSTRIYDENIDRIVELANKDNIDLIYELLGSKSEYFATYRYNGYQIRTILESLTDTNMELAEQLISARVKSDRGEFYRFNPDFVVDIFEATSEYNVEFINRLISMRKLDSRGYRFNDFNIVCIVEKINKENIDAANELIESRTKKDNQEDYRFDITNITSILGNITPDNTSIVHSLINMSEETSSKERRHRFTSSAIESILKYTNKDNIGLVRRIIDEKIQYASGERYRFDDPQSICSLIKELNEDNIEFISGLVDMKKPDKQKDEYRFEPSEIVKIAQLSNENELGLLNELINMKEIVGDVEYYKYDLFDIQDILEKPIRTFFESNLIDENTICNQDGLIASIARLSAEDREIALKILNKMDEKEGNPFTLREFVQIIEQIKAYRENNNLTDEDIDKLADNLASLNKKDKDFILKNYKDSKYYNPKEYFETFLYFKNLKTNDGLSIFGLEEFRNKIEKYGIKSVTNGDIDERIYQNYKALMDVDPSSTTASYLAMMINLIEIGKINPSAFRELNTIADLNQVGLYTNADKIPFDSDDKWNFSPNLKNDIDKLCNVIASNTDKTKLDDEIKEAFIPTVESDIEGIKKVKIGETYQIKGEKYIKIKSSEDSSESLNLSKETYLKLFPPVDRFSSSQQILGDCYCIETIMLLYSLPNERIKLLKMFGEDEDNNVSIKLPKSKDKVTFKNGEIDEKEKKDMYSSGADGFKMLELAFAHRKIEELTEPDFKLLSDSQQEEFLRLEEENPNDVILYRDENDEIKFGLYSELCESNPEIIKNYLKKKDVIGIFSPLLPTYATTMIAYGGKIGSVLEAFGYGCCFRYALAYKIITEENISKKIEKIKNNSKIDERRKKELIEDLKKHLEYRFKDNLNERFENYAHVKQSEDNINDNLINQLRNPDFYKNHIVTFALAGHAYSLTFEKDENGQGAFYVYNPHSQGVPIQINNADAFFDKDNFISGIFIA